LNDFEVAKKIGSGQFGLVLLAREKESGFIVALKLLSKQKIRKLNTVEHVVSEIKNHASLRYLFSILV
jgi:serine/threonine protein kinase